MKIYANGCSFTYGDELSDPSVSAWPVLLANKLGGHITNDAISGGTNYRTLYRTIKNSQLYDLYLIAWTTTTRFTFYKSDNNFEVNFNPQLANTLYENEKFYKEWGKGLYQYWYNELYSFKIWLQQIISLQSILQANNKKFLMINTMSNNIEEWTSPKETFINNVKNLINFDVMNDSQIIDEHNEIQYYLKLIDTSKWYGWNQFYINALGSQFKCGPGGHLLEQGNQHLADLLYNHLCLK